MKKLEPVHIKFLRWLNRKVDGFAARGGCAEAKRAQHPYGAPCSRATQATSNKEDGQLPIQPEGKRHILCAQTLIQIILIIIGVFFVTAAFLFFQIYNASKLDMAAKADAIVVLGAAQYNGKPSPVLEARLNHAYELYKKDLAPLIITTGGIYSGALPTGRQEKFSEGEVGKKYLERLGVPKEKIIAENQSLTTRQNLTRVKEIAEEKALNKIIFVSDPFHMYRVKQIAEDLKLTPFLSPTKESPIAKNKWIEFKYILREMFLVAADRFFDF